MCARECVFCSPPVCSREEGRIRGIGVSPGKTLRPWDWLREESGEVSVVLEGGGISSRRRRRRSDLAHCEIRSLLGKEIASPPPPTRKKKFWLKCLVWFGFRPSFGSVLDTMNISEVTSSVWKVFFLASYITWQIPPHTRSHIRSPRKKRLVLVRHTRKDEKTRKEKTEIGLLEFPERAAHP